MYARVLRPKHPGIYESLVDATFGTWESVNRAALDYWSGAFARRSTPLDVAQDWMTWWGKVIQRERPQWSHEHTITREWPIARLRDFSAADAPADQIATLILPPQAGHDSCIVDFAPGQSQVLTARENGCDRVFSMDWRGATQETKHTSVGDYVDVILEAIDLVGGKVNLVGDCQGGWLATIFAALHPERVHSLAVAGAPIDFHAGEPLIHDWVRFLTPGDNLGVYRAVVRRNNGLLPGEFLLGGFMGMQLNRELDRQLQLLARINDVRHVERYEKFETWFQWTQPLPGDFYLWVVEHLFQRNELIKGELVVRGRRVDLSAITCPLFLMAGENDHITPPPQVWALGEHAGTPAEQVHHETSTGGHLGLFMGHEALQKHWPVVFGAMARISSGALANA